MLRAGIFPLSFPHAQVSFPQSAAPSPTLTPCSMGSSELSYIAFSAPPTLFVPYSLALTGDDLTGEVTVPCWPQTISPAQPDDLGPGTRTRCLGTKLRPLLSPRLGPAVPSSLDLSPGSYHYEAQRPQRSPGCREGTIIQIGIAYGSQTR